MPKAVPFKKKHMKRLIAAETHVEALEQVAQAIAAEKEVLPLGEYTQAEMARIVSQASQLADHYRTAARALQLAIHKSLFFLSAENPTEGDRLMAKNALMSVFGYEEPKEWKSHWLYNHSRPSHQAVIDVVNNSLMQAARKGGVAEVMGLPDQFFRYLYEAVCWTDSRDPEEETPESFKYMGVTYRPLSSISAELGV